MGTGLQYIALARYCHGFWIRFASGLAMQQCAETGTDLTGNTVVSAMVDGGGRSVKNGKPVSAGFSQEIPRNFIVLLSVGEESGPLEQTVKPLYKKYFEGGIACDSHGILLWGPQSMTGFSGEGKNLFSFPLSDKISAVCYNEHTLICVTKGRAPCSPLICRAGE